MIVPVEQLRPSNFLLYLAGNSWERRTRDSRREIWEHPPTGTRVLIPVEQLGDFDLLAWKAVEQIAAATQESSEDVFHSLRWSSFDKLFISREHQADALSVTEAIDLHQAVLDTVWAAARSAVADEPQRVHRGARPKRATEFVEDVRLLPALQGSFILRALMPIVNEDLEQPRLLDSGVDLSLRRVTEAVLGLASEAVETAELVHDGAPIDIWDQTSPLMSSNLCDALARLPGPETEGGRAVLRVEWTWSAPHSPQLPVTVPAHLVHALDAGGAHLRRAPAHEFMQMVGIITKLHRESRLGPGEVTLRGLIEGRGAAPRPVRMELDESTYRQALEAHDEGVSVRIEGLVAREPRLRLVHLVRFQKVFDDDASPSIS